MKTHTRLMTNLAAFVVLAPIMAACANQPSEKEAGAPRGGQPRVVEISVTAEGFVPAEVKVKAGQPVKLVVTRQVEGTCATDIVIKDFGVQKALPLHQAVEVDFTPVKAGKVRYACAMDMIAGVIVVE
jgi:plastocyanin domain-containing protein